MSPDLIGELKGGSCRRAAETENITGLGRVSSGILKATAFEQVESAYLDEKANTNACGNGPSTTNFITIS